MGSCSSVTHLSWSSGHSRYSSRAYPVERTLLTTGALAYLMESAHQGHKRLETPMLRVAYRAPALRS